MTKAKWFVWLVPRIGAWFMRLLCMTLRLKIDDPCGFLKRGAGDPAVVFAFWHNRIFVMPYLYEKLVPHHTLVVMISRSRDGQMISETAARFGVLSARGSSSKKGVQAFREILDQITDKGHDIGVTPDGPRGPRCKIQPGVILLASMSGRPIVPVTYHLSGKFILKSWDRFQIPRPFSKCHLVISPPVPIPPDVSDEEIKKISDKLEKILSE